HVEVDRVDGGELPEPLGQPAGMDERIRRGLGHGGAWYRRTGPPRNLLHGGSTPCYDRAAPGRPDRPATWSQTMATMPEPVAHLLEAALVGELTVIDRRG